MAGGILYFWLFLLSLQAVFPYGVGFSYGDIKECQNRLNEDAAKAVWDNSGFSGFFNGTPINYMVDFDVATYYDYNLGLHHGICYSMVEVIYNATSSKAKEYKTCCRPLQQDPDWDTKRTLEERILTPPVNNEFTPTTECYCEGFQSVRRQRWKDLSKISIPMPSCLSRKQEERFVPDMIFISYTIEAGDPKFETRLWNQPFYINLDGLEVCPEDPIVIPWKSIYIALAFFAVFFILFSLRQFLRQKKAHAVQDIEQL